jgi:hypothetical protein
MRFIAADGTISTAAGDEPSFFKEVFGHPRHVRTFFGMFRTIAIGTRMDTQNSATLVPESILDHMPKAYACAIRHAASG